MNITHFKIQEYAVEWECTEKKKKIARLCVLSAKVFIILNVRDFKGQK